MLQVAIWRELARTGRLAPFVLLCLGIWLHAADTLLTATLMPAAVTDIGGVSYINWTIALYQVGSILTGAAAGNMALRFGLRRTLLGASLIYGLGCIGSAIASGMSQMLVGRLIQGLGGGMLLALSYVAIQMLFPKGQWTRLFAIESMVWGVAALCGPLIGGLFAEAGLWRGAFWAFAAQSGLLFVVVIAWMPKATAKTLQQSGWSLVPLLMLFAATIMIAQAGVTGSLQASSLLALAGLALLLGAAWLDGSSQARLLPRQLLEPWHPVGAGLLMVFAMAASTTAFWAYGPLILKVLFGVDTLVIGYILAAESIARTISTIAVSSVWEGAQPGFIRSGAALVSAGASGFMLFLPIGWLPGVILCVLLQGVGFGLSWPFLVGRIVALASPGEHALAASAAPTLQRVGYAVGGAATGIAANAAGLSEGVTIEATRSAAFWVFAAFIPLLIIANLAAHRFTSPKQ